MTGSCFSHNHEGKFETKALVTAIMIDKVESEDNCFPSHQLYVLNITFKYLTVKKSWKIKLDGIYFANPHAVLTEKGLNATVTMDPMYHFAGIGDFRLEISVSDGTFEKIIKRDICVRFLNKKVKVSAERVSMPGRPVTFAFMTTDPSLGICHIHFGDGKKYSSSTNIKDQVYVINSTYAQVGVYRYIWSVNNSTSMAQGTGEMTILNPVMESGHYLFPTWKEKTWPDNTVQFYLMSKCLSPIPNNVSYRIHFGDGEIMPWTRMPHFDCKNMTNLTRHTYKKAGCYETYFEMKNFLGRCEINGSVRIHQRLGSLRLDFKSLPPSRTVEKGNGGVREVYLKHSYPFEVTATVTDGGCQKFEWKIAKPYWFTPAGVINKILINHLVNKVGNYDLEVKAFNHISGITEKRKLFLTNSLMGLILLASKPDITGKTGFYMLLEDFGAGPEFIWDFKDGTVSKEKAIKFSPANRLPGISNIKETESLNLTRYMGCLRQHIFSSKGMYDVSITANDQLTSLVAKRTVFVSKRICKRPRVKILPKDQKSLQFSLGETLTVLSDVKLECDDFNKAVFEWRIYTGSKEAMDNDRVAESDKIMRLVTRKSFLCMALQIMVQHSVEQIKHFQKFH